MSLVSLTQGVADLAVRVGQECSSIRAAIASKADAVTALLKDSTPGAEWRAPALMTGGGTLSVSTGFAVSWTQRFTIMGNGRHALWSTGGFFEMTMPADGTVIPGSGGVSDVTVTNGAIVLTSWATLYYVLPIGSNNVSQPANFRIVGYTTAVTPIPDNWVPIVTRNADNGMFRWGNGIVLSTGQSWSVAGGYSWATGLTATVPPVIALQNALGAGTTAARSDHTHGFALGPLNAADPASSYPLGLSMMTLTATQTGWPSSLGQCVTWRYTIQRTVQQFFDKNGNMWVRAETGTDVWTAWTQVYSSTAYSPGLADIGEWVKTACKVATTTNIALSGLAAIDGVTPVAGDRILVKNQTATGSNGIYIAASGAWARASDADTGTKLASAQVVVQQGTRNAYSLWVFNILPGTTLGSVGITVLPVLQASDADTDAARYLSTVASDQSITSGLWTTVSLLNVDYTNNISQSAGVITVTRAGYYRFTANATLDNTAGTANRRTMMLEAFTTEATGSGTMIARQETGFVTGVFPSFSLAGEIYLAAGTKVRLVCWHNAGTAVLVRNTLAQAVVTVRRTMGV